MRETRAQSSHDLNVVYRLQYITIVSDVFSLVNIHSKHRKYRLPAYTAYRYSYSYLNHQSILCFQDCTPRNHIRFSHRLWNTATCTTTTTTTTTVLGHLVLSNICMHIDQEIPFATPTIFNKFQITHSTPLFYPCTHKT